MGESGEADAIVPLRGFKGVYVCCCCCFAGCGISSDGTGVFPSIGKAGFQSRVSDAGSGDTLSKLGKR